MTTKFIKYYFLPIVISVIAIFQLYQVERKLTRWKGGGFGMYSEFHFNDYEIWINQLDSEELKNKKTKKLIVELKKRPNELNSINLINALNLKKDTIILQVWKPKFDLSSSEYRRELIYEITYLNNKRS